MFPSNGRRSPGTDLTGARPCFGGPHRMTQLSALALHFVQQDLCIGDAHCACRDCSVGLELPGRRTKER